MAGEHLLSSGATKAILAANKEHSFQIQGLDWSPDGKSIASGSGDGTVKVWDVAGGAFIVQQAGGRLSDFSGGENYIFGKEIIDSSTALYEPFFEVVNSHFTK